jgi:hypothetical protein
LETSFGRLSDGRSQDIDVLPQLRPAGPQRLDVQRVNVCGVRIASLLSRTHLTENQLALAPCNLDLITARTTVVVACVSNIGRESHWQSGVLRNDRHRTCKAQGIRSLSGQLVQLWPLTRGSHARILDTTFSLIISVTCWRTRGDSNSR